jgi:hypothetical protein
MNTMRTIALTSAATALLAATSYGDITYSLPGLAEVKNTSGGNSSETASLGEHWKYVITGYTWKINAGDPVNGFIDGEGYYTDAEGNRSPVSTTITASLNGQTLTRGFEKFETDRITTSVDSSTTSEKLNGNKYEVTYTANGTITSVGGTVDFEAEGIDFVEVALDDVNLTVSESGSMIASAGSYIQFTGVAIKDTPNATGKLYPIRDGEQTTADSYYLTEVGKTPTIYWEIALNGESVNYTPQPDEITGEWEYILTTIEKNNNGHGNNIDGVDVSNPGKSKKHFYDPSGLIDDER